MDGGKISAASLAFGGLAPLPWRNTSVEQALIGQTPSDAVFDHAADLLLAHAKGYGANDFKIPLARRTLIACLRDMTGE